MPELPEVEVLRQSLARRLPGRRVDRVVVRSPALREPLARATLERLLEGKRVCALRRRAKYLLIDLDRRGEHGAGGEHRAEHAVTLVVHLGMSGRLTRVAASTPVARHEHLALFLDDGSRLRLVDARRFGLAFALDTRDLAADRHFAHLGFEPLDATFDGELLRARVGRRRGAVKGFLMDAGVVVGVGNIYASEALWRAQVHPRRSVARIAAATWQRIAGALRCTLRQAIAEGGTTLADFADGDGKAGYFQVSLAVYGRAGAPCLRCAATIRRIVQSNRSSFYCPACQH